MTYHITVEDDELREIIVGELRRCRKDLAAARSGCDAVFSTNQEEDARKIKKLRKAIKRVLAYYE